MRKTCNKEVNVYNLLGEYQLSFDSLTDCGIYFGSDTQTIWSALNVGTGRHKGFILKYSEMDYSDIEPRVTYNYIKEYLLYNKEGLVMEGSTTQELADYLGCSRELVRLSVNSGKWFCKKKFKVERKIKRVPAQHIKNIPVYEPEEY